MKLRSKLALTLCAWTLLSAPAIVAAENSLPERGCIDTGKTFTSNKPRYNCNTRPLYRDRSSRKQCIKDCGGDLLSASNSVIPKKVNNLDWKDAFIAGGYGPGDVYTDFILDIEKDQLSSAGVQTCEAFGLGAAFWKTTVGATGEQTITLSVAISESSFSLADIENSRALVYPVLEVKRRTEGGKCTAQAVTGAGGLIARVKAHPSTDLVAQILLVRGTIKKPLAGLQTQTGGSGADALLKTLLNGKLGSYAPDLTFIADNLQSSTLTGLGDNSRIRSYPLRQIGNDPYQYKKLEYDVFISGRSMAKFSIYQSPDISEAGPLQGARSFKTAAAENILVGLSTQTRQPEKETIDDALTKQADAYEFIRNPATFNNPGELNRACRALGGALAEYSLSEYALRAIKATMLFDFEDKGILRTARFKDICLKQEQRGDRDRYPNIAATFLSTDIGQSGQVQYRSPNEVTCIENYGEFATTVTREVTKMAYDELRGLYSQASSAKRLYQGDFFPVISIGGESPLDVVKRFNADRFCELYSQDTVDKRNTSCRFVYRATTQPPNVKHVWVGIQANAGGYREAPIIESYTIGIDVSKYVQRKALLAHQRESCQAAANPS